MTRIFAFLLFFMVLTVAIAQDSHATSSPTQNPVQRIFIAQADTTNKAQNNKEIQYVDDNLVIVMRAGNGKQYKIIRNLTSGTPLQVLQSSGDYSQVRTDNGTEGWVRTQYLSKTPIARDKLKQANQQLAKLSAQNNELKKELNTAAQENTNLSKENNELKTQLENFRTVAAKPMQIQEENQSLAKAKVSLENDRQMLQQEVQMLRDQSDKRWFLAGAGVLLCGMFLGLIIPKMRRRRKSDWSSL